MIKAIFDGMQKNSVWVGYVARISDSDPAKLVLDADPVGIRRRKHSRWVEQADLIREAQLGEHCLKLLGRYE